MFVSLSLQSPVVLSIRYGLSAYGVLSSWFLGWQNPNCITSNGLGNRFGGGARRVCNTDMHLETMQMII